MKSSLLTRLPFLRGRLDGHMQEMVSGAAVAFALKVLSAGLTFAFNVVIARLLGASGAGVYFLALTVASIGGVSGKCGIDVSLLRFIASGASNGDWAGVKGAYVKGIKFAFISSSVTAIVIFFAAPWFSKAAFSEPGLGALMRWMSLSIVPYALYIIHAEILKGLKRIAESITVLGVLAPAISVAGAFVLVPVWGVEGAVAAFVAACALTLLAGAALWRRATPQLAGVKGRFEASELWRSAMPMWGVAIVQLVFQWSATLMLGVWATPADVGVFGAAQRTAMLTSFVLIAVNSIAAPKFAALYVKGDMAALKATVRGSTKLITLMAAPVLVMFLVMPRHVMAIFGPQFASEGASLLSIMAIGQFVNAATGSVGHLLAMSGHERQMRNGYIISAVITVAVNIALIRQWGTLGAAVATAITVALQNLILVFIAWRKLGIMTIPGLGRWLRAR
ncbi:MAG: oligosaccharide flippase family protein [Deltaproteobacteria bacterium]|nr:oligosaccharide flippase family protein [Deltaproteobacteria bacterium]